MTENEAMGKWCPDVRCVWYPTQIPVASVVGWNRIGDDMNCIASECMKWPECKAKWESIASGNYTRLNPRID